MKKYLLFANAEYCYSILRPLQAAIRERGEQAAWFVSCSAAPLLAGERHLSGVAEVVDYAPDVVFAPGDWAPYFFPGAKVQIFHGIARNKRGAASERESDHYRVRGWFDLYCTQAQDDTEIFSQLSARFGTFVVAKTGWPKLDPLFRLRNHLSREGDKPVPMVFFASTFSPSITAAPKLAGLIEQLSASGRWRFVVTLHPKMAPEIVARYRAISNPCFSFVPAGEDLLPIMAEADLMLCDTSSIMYEFLFLDKPLVTFRTRNPGPYALNVNELDEVEPALKLAMEYPESKLAAARALCCRMHEFTDGQSSTRVLAAVDRLLDEQISGLKDKPLNFLRKLKVRSRLGYWGFAEQRGGRK